MKRITMLTIILVAVPTLSARHHGGGCHGGMGFGYYRPGWYGCDGYDGFGFGLGTGLVASSLTNRNNYYDYNADQHNKALSDHVDTLQERLDKKSEDNQALKDELRKAKQELREAKHSTTVVENIESDDDNDDDHNEQN